MAYTSNQEIILEWNYQKRKYLVGPTFLKGEFDGPTLDIDSLCKQSKNNFGIKLLKREKGPTSLMKIRLSCCCGSINGPTLLKKEILMACITNPKIILKQNFQKKKYLMGPTLLKKEIF